MIGVDNELAERHVNDVPRRNDTLAGPYGRRADQVCVCMRACVCACVCVWWGGGGGGCVCVCVCVCTCICSPSCLRVYVCGFAFVLPRINQKQLLYIHTPIRTPHAICNPRLLYLSTPYGCGRPDVTNLML